MLGLAARDEAARRARPAPGPSGRARPFEACDLFLFMFIVLGFVI